MPLACRYKITVIRIQYPVLLTLKHLYPAIQDNTALVKGMFVSFKFFGIPFEIITFFYIMSYLFPG